MVYEKNYFELVKYLISLDKMDAYVKDITILKIKWHLKKKNNNNKISNILIYETIFYKACKSGNLDLVQYLISSNKVYINERNILSFGFLIMFHTDVLIMFKSMNIFMIF